jgi:hypothetical protein
MERKSVYTINNLDPQNLTAICELNFSENVGASKSHNAMGLHGQLQGYLFIPICSTPPNIIVIHETLHQKEVTAHRLLADAIIPKAFKPL